MISPDRNPARLRFSIEKAAWQCVMRAIIAVMFGYLGYRFFVDPMSVRGGSYRPWLTPLLQSADGWPGVLFCLLCCATFVWWLILAGWRFSTNANAAEIAGSHVRLHRSFRRKMPIALAEVKSVEVSRKSGVSFLLPPHLLEVRWIRGKVQHRFLVSSNIIDGGKIALEMFAERLRAEVELTNRS